MDILLYILLLFTLMTFIHYSKYIMGILSLLGAGYFWYKYSKNKKSRDKFK